MPTLKLFKRTWNCADDELVLSSVFQAVLRIILVTIAGYFIFSNKILNNDSSSQPQIILIITIVICILQIIIYIILAIVSGRGGVMEIEKRRRLNIWLYIHLALIILELIFYGLSIWQISNLYNNYKKNVYTTYVAVIFWCVILIIAIAFEIIGWLLLFDIHGRLKYDFYDTFLYNDNSTKTDSEKRELIRKMRKIPDARWRRFMRSVYTSYQLKTDSRREDAIEAIGGALADYLTDVDMTASDLAVALLLLRWQSNQWIGGISRVPVEYVHKFTEPITKHLREALHTEAKNPIDKLERNWLHISRLLRYSILAKAAYGWLLYCFTHLTDCNALTRLCSNTSCSFRAAPKIQIDVENGIKKPGCCLCAGQNCYVAAFMEMTDLTHEDIVAFEVVEEFNDTTTMLVIDDATESIVLVVRGSLSGDDYLADALGVGEPLRDEDYNLQPDKQLIAHGGMGRTAKTISERVLEEQLFEIARRRRPNYPVVICGQSLGAGLVSLMCVFLKPHYPELKAYAFSPPGALMNKNLAKFTRDYLCSITYGYDCVTRMGGETLEDLRARVFHALCVYKTPKFITFGREMVHFILRNLFFRSDLSKVIKFDKEIGRKLLNPDMSDAYSTKIGSKFKFNLKDRAEGASKIDRLLPTERSLMRWKNPECRTLLILPRPYPRRLYPPLLREPSKERHYTMDLLIENMVQSIPSGNLLHIFEVDKDFENEGSRPYKKFGHVPPPVALWADPYTFNSILVHPKMVPNHTPMDVCKALGRLHTHIMKTEKMNVTTKISPWERARIPMKHLEKKITGEDAEPYSRFRKLK